MKLEDLYYFLSKVLQSQKAEAAAFFFPGYNNKGMEIVGIVSNIGNLNLGASMDLKTSFGIILFQCNVSFIIL